MTRQSEACDSMSMSVSTVDTSFDLEKLHFCWDTQPKVFTETINQELSRGVCRIIMRVECKCYLCGRTIYKTCFHRNLLRPITPQMVHTVLDDMYMSRDILIQEKHDEVKRVHQLLREHVGGLLR